MLRPRVETRRDTKECREVQESKDARIQMLAARVRCEYPMNQLSAVSGVHDTSVAVLILSNVEQSFLDFRLELASCEYITATGTGEGTMTAMESCGGSLPLVNLALCLDLDLTPEAVCTLHCIVLNMWFRPLASQVTGLA